MAKKKGKKGSKKERKAAKKSRKAVKKARKAAERAVKEAARRGKAARATKAAKPAPAPKPAKAAMAAPRAKPARAAGERRHQPRRQPESLRLRAVGPSLTVGDLDRSLAFYRDALGFTVKERWEEEGVLRGVELVAGRASFWLSQDDWKKGRDRVKGQGFRLYCTTTQDVDALAARAKAAAGTLLEEPGDRPWGGRDFAVVDPDGFTITIARDA